MGLSPALDARNKLGAATRHHPDDAERIAAARRELAAAKLEEYIRRTVQAAPPLTHEQRAHLVTLLSRATGGDANAAA